MIYFNGDWKSIVEEANVEMVKSLAQQGYQFDYARFTTEFIERLQRYYLEREMDFKEMTTSEVLKSLLVKNGYKNPPQTDLSKALEVFYKITEAHWKPEKDTVPLLESLLEKKYHLAIVSNASDEGNVNRLIDNANIREYFEIILISASVGVRKPHPQIFRMALDQWGVQPSQCIMVGDTLSADIEGANKIGMHNIWITRHVPNPGLTTFDNGQKPTYTIDTLSKIDKLIDDINFKP